MSSGRNDRPRRRLRRQLATTLIATALVSLSIVGLVNFFAARDLLEDGSKEQLVEVGESRLNSIERAVERTLARTSITAADPAVIASTRDFVDAFAELPTDDVSETADAALTDLYSTTVVEPLATLGIEVDVDDLLPDDGGRYLQSRFTVDAPSDTDVAVSYGDAIAAHDEFLQELAAQEGVDDVLLFSPAGEIVYTADRLTDLGVDLSTGRLAESELAIGVLDRLPRERAGDAILVDYELYPPAGGAPSAFALAAVEDGSEVVGAIGIRLAVDGLNAITTAEGDWEGVGLRDGETYVVGPELTLQSESRRWIEDPDGYLSRIDDERLATTIEFLGSPVGVQPVETEPVTVALDGETFAGSATNYLGVDTFTYARQILIGDVRWVVVAEQPIDELRAPLWEYVGRLALVMAIVLPLAALIGFLLANRLTRSIPPVVGMAEAIAGGERHIDIPDLGANEFGDLAVQLERMAAELGRQEAQLADEFEQRRELLRSVLPARLVTGDGEIDADDEALYLGTVIAVVVHATGDPAADERIAELLQTFGRLAEEHADQFGVERVRTAADRYLFVCGIDSDDDGADQAAAFAEDLAFLREQVADDPDEAQLDVSIGLATGAVATGVLEQGNLTFTVWGEPVRIAMAIVSLAEVDQTLVDSSTQAFLGEGHVVHPVEDVVALDGEPMTVFELETPETAPVPTGRGGGDDD